ncbi:hypothetical protein [Halostella sp. PRR32]|uniref:hypothetical protein n=1 Tax=Halostella sp. PRR32 TaxID=3098147 RepID=UPI002B1D1BD8|nr:hypothetical protein [Halostella sp. PRR32]
MSLHWTLFRGMLAEEWRLHTELFGGRRFAVFPLLVTALAAGTAWFLSLTEVTVATVAAGLHGLAFAFGLHTGSIGFVGRDAMENLLGDITMLVFSGRTLPVSRRTLLSVFLVKDIVYYGVLFLLPLTVAVAPLAYARDPALLARLPLLWATTTATFLFGAAVTFAFVGLSTRGLPGRVVGLLAAAAVGLAWAAGVDVGGATPYALYADPSLATAAIAVAPSVALAIVGLYAYDPSVRSGVRTTDAAFGRWRRRLGDDTGLWTKSLLDLHRSSGGIWKVLFSGGVLFAVSAALIFLTESVTGVEPSIGLSFGAILGLTAFTTYNWLTQFDDPDDYLIYPVGVADAFAAKFRAFLVLAVPNGLAYFALAVVWFGADPAHVAVGAVLLVGIELYLFGLTVALAGLQPNEFLFDSVLFAAFGAAVAAALVPVLIVSLVVTPVSTTLLGALAAAALLLGAVGVAVYRRAVPRWERRLLA